MKTFPMFLKMTGRRVVILGGGEQAAQKCRLALKTEAQVVLAAPALDDELAALAGESRITWHQGPIVPEVLDEAALIFVATGCPGADAALHAVAKTAPAVVNVVDRPDLCDAFTPSIVDRDPVVVAIGTEGTAPVLARQIKTRMEEMLEPRLGELAALAGRLRMAAGRASAKNRRALWRWVFADAPRQAHARGAEREAAALIKSAIEAGGPPKTALPQIAVVETGAGARDLLSLRAVQRLQEADVIFYDHLADPDLLELARRDAERVALVDRQGARPWPAEKIADLICAEAKQGNQVVRLVSPAARDAAFDALSKTDLPIELLLAAAEPTQSAHAKAETGSI